MVMSPLHHHFLLIGTTINIIWSTCLEGIKGIFSEIGIQVSHLFNGCILSSILDIDLEKKCQKVQKRACIMGYWNF